MILLPHQHGNFQHNIAVSNTPHDNGAIPAFQSTFVARGNRLTFAKISAMCRNVAIERAHLAPHKIG
jgi:hypothetical protein